MKNLFYLALLSIIMCLSACKKESAPEFVKVGDDGQFYIGDFLYRFVGTNFWYGAILASEGEGGNRDRLEKELDLMQQQGINNLRILVGADGREGVPSHIMPILQTAPGVYNDTILDGLDYLLKRLEERGMYAVLYLNNTWEWSGGFGAYLEWTGHGDAPIPAIDGYDTFCDYTGRFFEADSAMALSLDHVRNIVSRTNRYTGKPYSESPAIMSWQVANEPRCFRRDSIVKQRFMDWILATAEIIKKIDPNHLVSTGSEGLFGCEVDMDLWADIHNSPLIDYATIHIWPYNWRWISKENIDSGADIALRDSKDYLMAHRERTAKPLVIEEFGYPRNSLNYDRHSSVAARDEYYRGLLTFAMDSAYVAGCNFWAWGGLAKPKHTDWEPWDDYTGDPAQEPQGLYSVFATDTTTLRIIKNLNTHLQ